MIERTYRIDGVETTKAGTFLVLKSTHDTLKIAVDAREADILRSRVRETIKLSLTSSRPSSVPPSSKVRG